MAVIAWLKTYWLEKKKKYFVSFLTWWEELQQWSSSPAMIMTRAADFANGEIDSFYIIESKSEMLHTMHDNDV